MRVSTRKRLSRRNGSLRRKVSLFASSASLALGGCAEVGDEYENVTQHSQAMMNEAAEGARPKRDDVILPAAEHLSDIERFWDQAVLPPLALQEIAMYAHRVQMSSAHFRKWLHLHADFIRRAKGNGEVAAGLREAYRAQILRLGAAVPTHKSVARLLAFACSQKSYSQGAPGRPPPDEADINDFAPLAEQLMLNIERTLATGAAPDQASVAELAYVVELFQAASLQTFEAHKALRPGEWDLGPALSVDPILTANLAYLRQTTKRFFDLLVLARDGRAHAANERVAPHSRDGIPSRTRELPIRRRPHLPRHPPRRLSARASTSRRRSLRPERSMNWMQSSKIARKMTRRARTVTRRSTNVMRLTKRTAPKMARIGLGWALPMAKKMCVARRSTQLPTSTSEQGANESKRCAPPCGR